MERKTNIVVQLSGEDGNAFSIIARVTRAMRRCNVEQKVIEDYRTEAMSGDYDHLLQTTMKYVDVE